MVVWQCQGQPTWLVEDRLGLLEQPVLEGLRRGHRDCPGSQLLNVITGGAKALPQDVSGPLGECHT